MIRSALLLAVLLSAAPVLAQPAPSGVDSVYAFPDVPPEMVGGLAALMSDVEYPEAALQAGAQGRVVIQVVVGADGRLVDATVVHSPSSLLDEAALAAANSAQFTPGRHQGVPVASRLSFPVEFALTEPQPDPMEGMTIEGMQVEYPEGALRDRVEGDVVVSFGVDTSGRAIDPMVVSSPDDRLSDAALDAVRDARFGLAAGRGGAQPSDVRVEFPVEFRLDDGPRTTVETPPVLIGGLRGLQALIEYPEDVRREGIQGQVLTQFTVGVDGRPHNVRVVSSPDMRLSKVARDVVQRVRFEPATVDGKPVAVSFGLPLSFRLR